MAITIREGRAVHGEEIIIERPDGVRRYVLPHPRAIFDSSGNLIQAVNMLVDITELKKQEQAVRESEEKFRSLAANVEKQVEDRTRELQTTNRELVKSNDELEQFAYVASHDLQEPLRKIHAFTNLLEHHLGDENKSKYYIGKIADSSGKMMALIRELLDFSKLSTSREPYAKVDLNELIDAVKDDFELVIKQRNASIESSRLPIIDGIRLHFHQLFHNLLSNSLKFCKEDVQPRISIDVRKMTVAEVKARPALNPQLDYTVIEWKDNGMGFSQQYADHIFTIFQRLDHPPAYPGTGIGLALCRKIVTDHHGEIYARSEESQGATFFVILPETQETQDAG
jgi:light-regulated signal transduction histidine kinase (bacteriophytochrome)